MGEKRKRKRGEAMVAFREKKEEMEAVGRMRCPCNSLKVFYLNTCQLFSPKKFIPHFASVIMSIKVAPYTLKACLKSIKTKHIIKTIKIKLKYPY